MKLSKLNDAYNVASEIGRQRNMVNRISSLKDPYVTVSMYEHGSMTISREDLLTGLRNRISQLEKLLQELGVEV